MKTIHIRPKLAYRLLGTELRLDPEKVYPAIHARNIPDWKERGLVFVGPDCGIMLEDGEYEIVKHYKPEPTDED
jgi:hypothetical protein